MEKFTSVHLVVRVLTMEKVDRLTDAVVWRTGQATLSFTPCMAEYVAVRVLQFFVNQTVDTQETSVL
jgi:hypothetical protein